MQPTSRSEVGLDRKKLRVPTISAVAEISIASTPSPLLAAASQRSYFLAVRTFDGTENS